MAPRIGALAPRTDQLGPAFSEVMVMTLYLLVALAGLYLGVLLGVFGVALCLAAKRVNEYLPPNPLETPVAAFPTQQPQ